MTCCSSGPYAVGSSTRMRQYLAAQAVPPTCPPTAGNPIADATVVGKIKLPDGTVVVLTVTNDSGGYYHMDYTPTMMGLHQYEFLCTGTAILNSVGQFLVNRTVF